MSTLPHFTFRRRGARHVPSPPGTGTGRAAGRDRLPTGLPYRGRLGQAGVRAGRTAGERRGAEAPRASPVRRIAVCRSNGRLIWSTPRPTTASPGSGETAACRLTAAAAAAVNRNPTICGESGTTRSPGFGVMASRSVRIARATPSPHAWAWAPPPSLVRPPAHGARPSSRRARPELGCGPYRNGTARGHSLDVPRGAPTSARVLAVPIAIRSRRARRRGPCCRRAAARAGRSRAGRPSRCGCGRAGRCRRGARRMRA